VSLALFDDGRESGALLSPCRTYRYILWRQWAEGNRVAFIGFNPSKADEQEDDATIRRCIGFARLWGYSGIVMLNLFAYRSTDPKILGVHDPIGPENDASLACAKRESLVVAAWGELGRNLDRTTKVLTAMRANGVKLHCLGRTSMGAPRHPVRLPYAVQLEGFP
jgi:hypothetical protein